MEIAETRTVLTRVKIYERGVKVFEVLLDSTTLNNYHYILNRLY